MLATHKLFMRKTLLPFTRVNLRHFQNYGGFTGNIEGGPTANGPRRRGSKKNSEDEYEGSYLQEFFKLPILSKRDQLEIVGELTKGCEVNMTPS